MKTVEICSWDLLDELVVFLWFASSSFKNRSFFPKGIMLVYDITNEKSFDNIKNWIRNIEEVCPK